MDAGYVTVVDVYDDANDLCSFEFASETEANQFADVCEKNGYRVENVYVDDTLMSLVEIESLCAWTALEAFEALTSED